MKYLCTNVCKILRNFISLNMPLKTPLLALFIAKLKPFFRNWYYTRGQKAPCVCSSNCGFQGNCGNVDKLLKNGENKQNSTSKTNDKNFQRRPTDR